MISNFEAYMQALTKVESLAIQAWIEPFKKLVDEYRKVDGACGDALQSQLDKQFDFSLLLEHLEPIISQYVQLAGKLPDIESGYAPQEILTAWEQASGEAAQAPSKRFTVSIPKRHLQPNEGDPTFLSSWKTIQRLRLRIWESYRASSNWIRRLAKRKELSKPRFKRRVRYSAYLTHQVLIPVEQSLQATWMSVMAELAELLIILHDDTHERILDLMLLDQQHLVLHKKEINQLVKHLESLRTRPVRFEVIDERILALKQTIATRMLETKNQIRSNIQNSWFTIGTAVYPNFKHHLQLLDYSLERSKIKVVKLQHLWQRYFLGEQEDRLKDLEIALLQIRIPLKLLAGVGTIREQITQQILPAFANPHKVVSDALQRFRDSESATESAFRKDIISQNRSLLRDLRRELLPRILESILQARLANRLTNLNSQVKYLIDQLAETHTVFRGRRMVKGRPQARFITIELKALVMGEVFPEIQAEFSSFIQQIGGQSDKLSRDITEIDQIIEFNLGAALELLTSEGLDSSQAGAFTVVTEGLERARNQLAKLMEESQNIHILCRDTLPRISQGATRRLLELANNEKVIDLQLRITRAKLKDQFLAYQRRSVDFIRSLWPKLLAGSQKLWQSLLSWYRRIRKITGLAKIPSDIDRQLNKYLTETRLQIDSLPFVYQRLFRFEPAADERFFIGRDQELKTIQDRFNEFKAGRNITLALVGESGSGRTSLLNMAESKTFARNASYRISLHATIHTSNELLTQLKEGLNLPEAKSILEITQILRDKPSKVIVIVENIQNMFLRVPGGFEAIKLFLLLMNETSQNVFWVISCGLYSWSYFERVLHIRGFFQEIITLQEMDDESIENVIMKRHRVSGYQLEFEVPDNMDLVGRWRRTLSLTEQQELLRKNFFEQLNRLATGNLTVAILFWLKAVREIKADRFIIAPFIEFDPTFLTHMPTRDLFTFAAFLQHETLTVEHHAQVFHQDLETSLLQISRLEKTGILVKKSTGYQIHYLLYRPVVRTLTSHNILH